MPEGAGVCRSRECPNSAVVDYGEPPIPLCQRHFDERLRRANETLWNLSRAWRQR